MSTALQFELPQRLEAHEPPEARGIARDEVRLLVAGKRDGRIAHAQFKDLPAFLAPGDLVVVNTSATLPAAVPTESGDLVVHLSTDLGGGRWVVEVREPVNRGSRPHQSTHRVA